MTEPTPPERSDISEAYWHLKECSLFDCLSDEELGALSASVRLDILLRRQHLAYDDPGKECVFFVKKGYLKLLRLLPDGQEVIIDLVGPGEFFGRIHARTTEHSHVREMAEATETATVCVLRRTDFERHLAAAPHLSREVMANLDDRVERIRERVVDLAFRSAPQRLAGFFDRYVENYGTQQHNIRRAPLPLSQQEVGYLAGMSRQSVTTLMHTWREEQIIDFDRQQITIVDRDRLQQIIQGN